MRTFLHTGCKIDVSDGTESFVTICLLVYQQLQNKERGALNSPPPSSQAWVNLRPSMAFCTTRPPPGVSLIWHLKTPNFYGRWANQMFRPPASFVTLNQYLTLFGAGGGFWAPSGFSCAIAKRRKIESSYLVNFSRHSLRTF